MACSIEHTLHRGHLEPKILAAIFIFAAPVQGIAETAEDSDTIQLPTSSNGDAWQFEVTPYLFAAGLNGQVGVRGVTADVDMSFNDIWDNLDTAFMGTFTAQKGRWIYSFDGVYFKINDEGSRSVTGPFGNVTVDGALQLTTSVNMYQGSVGYRIFDDTTLVDLVGAVRYTQVKTDMNVALSTTPPISFPPGGTLSAGGSEDWVDGVLGVLVFHPVSDTVDLLGYADIGGGGSDLSYQLIAGVNWEFVKNFTAKAGYRIMDWDYKNAGTVWDMQANGMYLGVGFTF